MKSFETYTLFEDYPDVMSVAQLQSALGVGRSKAYDLVTSSDIKSFRIGTAVRIPKTSVISYIQEMCYNETSSGQATQGCQEGVHVL